MFSAEYLDKHAVLLLHKSIVSMRIIHRYLGFFLTGIMAVYAISGVVLIFRKTDFLKHDKFYEKTIPTGTPLSELGTALNIKDFKISQTDGSLVYFKEGSYDQSTGAAKYTLKELPFFLDKMTKMHKATTGSPLFFLNIFFGIALLFFVISAFWMFLPSSPIFRKGLLFAAGGIILTLIMLFV
jgi:hypothetical protein